MITYIQKGHSIFKKYANLFIYWHTHTFFRNGIILGIPASIPEFNFNLYFVLVLHFHYRKVKP